MNTLEFFRMIRSPALGRGHPDRLDWSRFNGLGRVPMAFYLAEGLAWLALMGNAVQVQ